MPTKTRIMSVKHINVFAIFILRTKCVIVYWWTNINGNVIESERGRWTNINGNVIEKERWTNINGNVIESESGRWTNINGNVIESESGILTNINVNVIESESERAKSSGPAGMQVHSLIHSAFPIIVIVRDFASVCPCNWVNMGGHGANLLGHIVFFFVRGVLAHQGGSYCGYNHFWMNWNFVRLTKLWEVGKLLMGGWYCGQTHWRCWKHGGRTNLTPGTSHLRLVRHMLPGSKQTKQWMQRSNNPTNKQISHPQLCCIWMV